jgi:FdhD protein
MRQQNRQETMSEPDRKGNMKGIAFDRFSKEGWDKSSSPLPDEIALTIYVNHQELVTIQCTPAKLNSLVIGFLYAEGIIDGTGDVASMRVCEEESLAEVMLSDSQYELPKVHTLTSGCGGGIAFKKQEKKVESDLVLAPEEVLHLMRQLQEQMEMYRLCGGVHASALSDTRRLLVVAEDIGRHNTLDKIQGECLLKGLPTRNRLLLSTGRVSSEMLLKAARMDVPVVVSRHSPTRRAVFLARDLGITLVGHARGSRLSVYSHHQRLKANQNR